MAFPRVLLRYGTVRFPDRDYPPAYCKQQMNHSGPPFKLCDLSWVMGPKDAIVCACYLRLITTCR